MTSIICVGDFGVGNKAQYNVSYLIEYLIEKYNGDLILGLGDNIYPEGVTNINDIKFIERFENPYSNLPKRIKFYNILGNHDYKGNIKAQIKYTNYSDRWTLPNNFYCFKKNINRVPVEFFAIDTNVEKLSERNRKIQEKWVTDALKNSRARWRIVYGHHPWKSTGSHGNANNYFLNSLYNKIVETHKVDIILSGRDHDQQHIHIPNLPNLVISGTGSKVRSAPKIFRTNNPYLKFYSENLGCCIIEVSSTKLDIHFYNTSKKKEYSFKIQK